MRIFQGKSSSLAIYELPVKTVFPKKGMQKMHSKKLGKILFLLRMPSEDVGYDFPDRPPFEQRYNRQAVMWVAQEIQRRPAVRGGQIEPSSWAKQPFCVTQHLFGIGDMLEHVQ